MAHFAKLDDTNTVIDVHVVNNDALDFNDEEASGIEFLTKWSGGYTNWKQTSYNGSIRKNYAGIGFYYDQDLDAFIPPKPFDSWILNTEICNWQAPIEKPNAKCYWSENDLNWIIDETLAQSCCP